MEQSFGARLRAQREQQQVALADIAEQSKIKLSLLVALERDDVSQWPSGIFRRSYVRTYARAIGLDPEAVLQEFLERYPDPEEDAAAALTLTVADDRRPPPTRLRFLLGSALGALRARPRGAEPPPSIGDALEERGPFLERQDAREPEVAAAHDWSGSALDVELTEAPLASAEPQVVEPPAPAPVAPPAAPQVNVAPPAADALTSMATLSARLARVQTHAELTRIFRDAAGLLGAVGLLLWVWDDRRQLRPVLGHGYAHELLAQIGALAPTADNAIGAAARSGDMQIVDGSGGETGALAVPLMTAGGCAGVLAIELRPERAPDAQARACATILAAQLAGLIGTPAAFEAASA